jgi:AAHS family 4-hydroxybenzoate transporter-like MFS transporter
MARSDLAAVDVGRTIDEGRWGAYQRWLIFFTALTIIFDGIDNQLLGISIPAMMRDWAAPRSAFAPVVSLGYLGMMIGGAVAGIAGDRFGRRVALLASMVVFGAATLAVAGADTVGSLAVLRLAAGLGLGGAMPNAAALAAEYVPLRQRPFAVTVTIVCVPLGGTLAGLLALPALPAVGWRGLFAIGGAVPLVAALIFARLLPESPRFLARHPKRWPELARVLQRMGHDVDRDAVFADVVETRVTRAPLKTLFDRDYRRDTFALWTAFFSCLLAVYLGFSWLPSILTGAGLSGAVANTGITLFNLGGVVGAVAGAMLITRFGSRPTMLTMAAAAVGGAVVLSMMSITSVVPVLVMLTVTGGMINAVQTTMYALAAHVYPTRMRATGVGTAVAFGRTGAILTGYAGPWALEYRGSMSFFALMAAAVFVTFIALALVGRHVPRPSS